MLDNYRKELELITRDYSDKQLKKLRICSLLRLADKLQTYNDNEIESMMIEVKDLLSRSEDMLDYKSYKNKICEIKKLVTSKFDLQERGSVSSQYVGIGIAIGTGVGVAFMSINAAMMSVFTALGIVFGTSIGNQKEKALDKEGKIY